MGGVQRMRIGKVEQHKRLCSVLVTALNVAILAPCTGESRVAFFFSGRNIWPGRANHSRFICSTKMVASKSKVPVAFATDPTNVRVEPTKVTSTTDRLDF